VQAVQSLLGHSPTTQTMDRCACVLEDYGGDAGKGWTNLCATELQTRRKARQVIRVSRFASKRGVTDGTRTRDLRSHNPTRPVAEYCRIGLSKPIFLLAVAYRFCVLRSGWCQRWCQMTWATSLLGATLWHGASRPLLRRSPVASQKGYGKMVSR
jgi:hypothetical protein